MSGASIRRTTVSDVSDASAPRHLGPERSRPPRQRRQPLELQVGAGPEQIDPFGGRVWELNFVAPPVGPPAVLVGHRMAAPKIQEPTSMPVRARTSGSAASAAIARPTNSGDS